MFETVEVSSLEVICDGGNTALGHPRIYLHIDQEHGNKVKCPYCSRTFILRHAHAHEAA